MLMLQESKTPYTIFKYIPSSDSYIELTPTVDTENKMMTVTVTSNRCSSFAIGGAPVVVEPDGGFSTTNLAILAVSIVVIVLLVVFGVWYFKKKTDISNILFILL